MNGTIVRPALGAIAALALCVATASPVLGANGVTTMVSGGTRSASASAYLLRLVATGPANRSLSGTLSLVEDDSSGTGAGWNVTIQTSVLVYSGANGSSPSDDVKASRMIAGNPGAVHAVAGMSVDATHGPSGIGHGGPMDTAVRITSAQAGYGVGTYLQAITFTLAIPGDIQAGGYTTTLTITISSGP